jgi:hypothetical protein
MRAKIWRRAQNESLRDPHSLRRGGFGARKSSDGRQRELLAQAYRILPVLSPATLRRMGQEWRGNGRPPEAMVGAVRRGFKPRASLVPENLPLPRQLASLGERHPAYTGTKRFPTPLPDHPCFSVATRGAKPNAETRPRRCGEKCSAASLMGIPGERTYVAPTMPMRSVATCARTRAARSRRHA